MKKRSRPLDFIIFGVPRSGTKGLVRAVNLHPHVFCAMERFHFRVDHSAIRFPASFLDTRSVSGPSDLAKVKRIRQEISAKAEIEYAGNKLPRYYFALDRINREIPDLKNIWIYRSPYSFMPSWNQREERHRKAQWPAGQVGLFGLLELFICIENALSVKKDIFVFPYNAGLLSSPQITLQSLDFLGADTRFYETGAFNRMQQRRRRRVTASLQDFEQEALDSLDIRVLDAVMDREGGVMLSHIAPLFKEYLNFATDRLPAVLDRAFAASLNKALPSFARQYFSRYQAELKPFLGRAHGCRSIADFQHFGPLERLKALYVQRWALIRRVVATLPRDKTFV